MKKVLIPLAIKDAETEFPIYMARETYLKKLINHNLLPLLVPSVYTEQMIEELYTDAGGILLMGGNDLNPQLYDQEKHAETEVKEPQRDTLELNIVKRALQDKKPILGICRGCQVLNVAAGGDLVQHTSDVAEKENHRPVDYKDKDYKDLLTLPKHSIKIEQGSKINQILKKDTLQVNSFHHQSVGQAGKNLNVVGCSKEGIVEIIEHTDKDYFCFGIQSHPEAEEDSFMEEIFERFAKSIQ